MSIEKQYKISTAIEQVQAVLGTRIEHIAVVGSIYISDRLDSDVDIVVVARGYHSTGEGLDDLDRANWEYGGSDKGGDGWTSFKKTHNGVLINCIIVDDFEYWEAWVSSAEVCRALYLLGTPAPREVVHAIHSIIMDKADAETELVRRQLYVKTTTE